jgi:hypothetical protein
MLARHTEHRVGISQILFSDMTVRVFSRILYDGNTTASILKIRLGNGETTPEAYSALRKSLYMKNDKGKQ